MIRNSRLASNRSIRLCLRISSRTKMKLRLEMVITVHLKKSDQGIINQNQFQKQYKMSEQIGDSLPTLTFDQVLNDRVGVGRYQYESFSILSFIDLIDGMQEFMMSIVMAILIVQWQLTQTQAALFGSMYFIGMFFGNLFCGFFGDKIGRKSILVYSMFLTFVTILLTAFSSNYEEMAALRFIIGLLFGSSIPISMVVMGEMVPTRSRGMYIVLLQIVFTLGKLYIVACGYIFLRDFEHGDWQNMLIANSVPAFICFLGSIYLLNESPRFLLQQGRIMDSYDGIDLMLIKNSKELLTDTEKSQLRNYYAVNEHIQKINKSQTVTSIMNILSNQYLRITLSVWAIFILQNVQAVGLFTLLPFIYQISGNGFSMLLLATCAEIPATLLFAYLVDDKQKGGRIRLTFLGFFLQGFSWLMIYFFKAPAVASCMIFGRFALRMVYSGVNCLVAESYPTAFRSLGVGSAQAAGQLFCSFSPFLYFPMYYYEPYLAFLISGIICIVAGIITIYHPIDLTLKPLDELEVRQMRSSLDSLEISSSNTMTETLSSSQTQTAQGYDRPTIGGELELQQVKQEVPIDNDQENQTFHDPQLEQNDKKKPMTVDPSKQNVQVYEEKQQQIQEQIQS